MITIRILGGNEFVEALGTVPRKLQAALLAKVEAVTDLLYAKVEENLHGKVLQTKTGALAASIVASVDVQGDRVTGFVRPVPADAKALVHEYGGKNYYSILPVSKKMLAFEVAGKKIVTPYVYHPPLAERSYLRSALAEIAPVFEDEMIEALDNVRIS